MRACIRVCVCVHACVCVCVCMHACVCACTVVDKKKFRLRFMFLVRRFRFASAENACFIYKGNRVNEELLISK